MGEARLEMAPWFCQVAALGGFAAVAFQAVLVASRLWLFERRR